jgi:hypothetical protein
MESVGPTLPVCSFCGLPRGIGTFSDDRSAYFCVGCQAVAKQFLDIQASLYPENKALVDEFHADRLTDPPGNGSPV